MKSQDDAKADRIHRLAATQEVFVQNVQINVLDISLNELKSCPARPALHEMSGEHQRN